ncbi:OmpA family protein [bacterium]|nr:OmpA family protein [bacterium]
MTLRSLLFFLLLCLSVPFTQAHAQSTGNQLSFGFDAGGVKYWGEFTDNQFWLAGDAFARYNIIPYVSIHAMVSFGQARYKVDQMIIDNFPEYFGADSRIGDFYPGSGTRIEEKNAVRFSAYDLVVSVNFFPDQRVVPFLFAGVGLLEWNPAVLTKNEALPNKGKNVYDGTQVTVPFGLGFESYITSNLVINGRATMRVAGTDYFDDLKVEGSGDDALLTFGLGLSYYLFGARDTDGDGLTDDEEEEQFKTDPKNPDTDGDGLNDYEEVRVYSTDPLESDSDGDNLTDYDEIFKHGTAPNKTDTDSDGLDDGKEIARSTNPMVPDTDGDGLIDGDEVTQFKTDPGKADTDADGLSDGEEIQKYTTDPLANDTDADGLLDGDELNTYKTKPTVADSDDDGLTDGDEVHRYKTNPLKSDTDDDRLNDGEEVQKHNTNPLIADTDSDLLMDGEEISDRYRTDPLDPDTDSDTIIDGKDDCPLLPGVASAVKGRNGCPEAPKVGTRLDFPDIFFVVNTDRFNYEFPQTLSNLDTLLAFVKQCEGLRIRIEGHASKEGSDERNQELSEMRAKRVKDWLIERGVSREKIESTQGYGSRQQKVAEPTGRALKKMSASQLESIRRLNRRITIEVTHTCDQ